MLMLHIPQIVDYFTLIYLVELTILNILDVIRKVKSNKSSMKIQFQKILFVIGNE